MKSLPVKNLIRKPGRTAALMLLTAFLALAVFGGSLVVLSLRQGLNSLEARLGADIIVVPSEAQSKVSFQNMFLQGTTGAFYMDAENLKRVREIEGVEKAAPQIFLASLKADCCSVKIQVIGFDPQADFTVQPWIAQSYARELGEMDVVVGCKVEAGVGEILRIYDQRCKVVGRLAATGTGLDTAVYCNLDTIRLLLQAAEEKGVSHKVTSDSTADQVSAIYVKVKEGYDVGRVNTAIQGHTRKASAVRTRSMITDVSDSLAGISRTVTGLIGAVWVLAFLILLIGVLGVCAAALLAFPFATLIETALGLPYLTPDLRTVALLAAAAVAAAGIVGSLASAGAAWRLSRVDPGTILREGA